MMDQCAWLLIRLLREKGLITETEYSWLNNAWNMEMETVAKLSEDDQRAFVRDFVMQIPFSEYLKMVQQVQNDKDSEHTQPGP